MIKLITVTALICGFMVSAQSNENTNKNFSVKAGVIFWENTFVSDSLPAINYFKDNLKIPNPKRGMVTNQKMRCRGGAIYTNSKFQFTYKINYFANSYTVTVSEMVFDAEMQLSIGSVSTSTNKYTIEELELRTRDGAFRKNQQSAKNLECLNEYFIKTFSINPGN